jgi:hypothetical protein
MRFNTRDCTNNSLSLYDQDWNLVESGAWKYEPSMGNGIPGSLAVGSESSIDIKAFQQQQTGWVQSPAQTHGELIEPLDPQGALSQRQLVLAFGQAVQPRRSDGGFRYGYRPSWPTPGICRQPSRRRRIRVRARDRIGQNQAIAGSSSPAVEAATPLRAQRSTRPGFSHAGRYLF